KSPSCLVYSTLGRPYILVFLKGPRTGPTLSPRTHTFLPSSEEQHDEEQHDVVATCFSLSHLRGHQPGNFRISHCERRYTNRAAGRLPPASSFHRHGGRGTGRIQRACQVAGILVLRSGLACPPDQPRLGTTAPPGRRRGR